MALECLKQFPHINSVNLTTVLKGRPVLFPLFKKPPQVVNPERNGDITEPLRDVPSYSREP